MVEKYGFDALNQIVFVNGTQKLGRFAYQIIDMQWIDRIGVDGFARSWMRLSGLSRGLQSGFVGRYAFGMVCGLFALIVVVWVGI